MPALSLAAFNWLGVATPNELIAQNGLSLSADPRELYNAAWALTKRRNDEGRGAEHVSETSASNIKFTQATMGAALWLANHGSGDKPYVVA